MKYAAMIGFGKRATAVLVDLNALLEFLANKRTIPSFEDLIQVKLEEDFKNLTSKSTWKKKATPQHAILIPSLSEMILERRDMTPKKFLSLDTKVIREKCIRLWLEKSQDKQAKESTSDKGDMAGL